MRLLLAGCGAIVATVCLVDPVVPAGGEARLTADQLTRSHIRSLPIEARPNRPIHFYGNAVRRRHHRAASPTPTRPLPGPTMATPAR